MTLPSYTRIIKFDHKEMEKIYNKMQIGKTITKEEKEKIYNYFLNNCPKDEKKKGGSIEKNK